MGGGLTWTVVLGGRELKSGLVSILNLRASSWKQHLWLPELGFPPQDRGCWPTCLMSQAGTC